MPFEKPAPLGVPFRRGGDEDTASPRAGLGRAGLGFTIGSAGRQLFAPLPAQVERSPGTRRRDALWARKPPRRRYRGVTTPAEVGDPAAALDAEFD